MAKESQAPVKVKGINQIAIVVKDLEKTAQDYWNILGIGPWDVYDWESPGVYNRTYYGQPSWAREKIALVQVGGVQLELVQPVEGPSIYADWLNEHGPGLHHMNFLVDDVEETVKTLESIGFPEVQSGYFGPPAQKGSYHYIPMPALRTIWEPVHVGEDIGIKPTLIPAKGEPSPSKIKVKGINQVAIVVKDLKQVCENYWTILGIGPWEIYDWEAPLVYDRKYKGKPAWAREKIALVQVGGVQLELVQPVEGPSVYADALAEQGEGLHHLNFIVDDVDEAEALLAERGFVSAQSGRWEPRAAKGAFNYIPIPPLANIWEPVHGTEVGAKPIMWPQV